MSPTPLIFAAAIMCGGIASGNAAWQQAAKEDAAAAHLRDWTRGIAHDDDRLIGFRCGPDALTMTAVEEDHFPRCAAIMAPDEACPSDADWPADEPMTAYECARYFGDNWTGEAGA